MMLPTNVYTSLLIILIALTMRVHATLSMRILTHNIRYATKFPFEGEKPWADRKQLILNELHYNTLHNPESFICLQEVLHEQLVDIMSGLGDEWSYIGVGRDDGKQAGEYSPILFRKAVWSVDEWKTVWLSPTPSLPSKGWDAGSIRIVTLGFFTHRCSKSQVLGLSTHFDNEGAVSRHESAKIILNLLEGQDIPIFLAGDLNSEPDGTAYRLLNGEDSPLRDAKGKATWRYGDEITCTGFENDEMTVIDYVFLGKGWGVEGYAVLPNRWDEGVYASDHRAVVVDAFWKG